MTPKREKQANHLIADVMDATGKGDISLALRRMEELESRFSDTLSYLINAPACLIETGGISGDQNLLQRGIELGGKAIEALPEDNKHRGTLHTNLGNGYYYLFGIDHRSGRPIDLYNYPPLQSAKTHFRRAIGSEGITAEVRKRAMVGLANVYDSLGRTVEAIHLYEQVLALDKSFTMAEANLGQALMSFAAICGEYQVATIVQAHRLMSDALSRRTQILESGGAAAVEFFEKQSKTIAAQFRDPSILEKPLQHREVSTTRLTKTEQAYYRFCHEHRLFLNFHIHTSDVLCQASVVDNIMFSLIEQLKSNSRFFYLAKYVNQMKEDFATARYLLFQSMHKHPYVTRISELTRFVDTLDYVENNLYVGMAKTAFERAYSVLDKIGAFLNAYLNLQTQGNIYFTTIWARKTASGWEVKESIRQNKNPSLLGLYDVNHDFRTGEYADIVAIRNALAHDRLSLVDSLFLGPRDRHEEEMVVGIDRFTQRTIDLLLIVKSCVTNMVNFVNLQEQSNKPGNGVVVPMFYYHQHQKP